VHVSQLADRYVSDPNQVVAVGQRVKVRVMSVDLPRNRIALSMKKEATGDSRPRNAVHGQKPKAERSTPKAGRPKPFAIPEPGTVAPNGMRFK